MITDIKSYLQLIRFRSWVGWLAIFIAGSFIFEFPTISNLIVVGFVFCCFTSAIFVQNQYFDKETDKKNIKKNMLPIAANSVSKRASIIFMAILFVVGLTTLALFRLYIF